VRGWDLVQRKETTISPWRPSIKVLRLMVATMRLRSSLDLSQIHLNRTEILDVGLFDCPISL
jgi:hypothetical protein